METIKSWDLGEYILEVLELNGIDESNIAALTPELIAEMLPLIGPRMKFISKWTATYGRTETDATTSKGIAKSINNNEEKRSEVKNYKLERQDAFSGEIAFALRTRSLSVSEILQKSIKGQAILLAYEKNKKLSTKGRNILVDTIVTEILAETQCLKNDDLKFIAEKIVELFPTEILEIYYISPVQKKDSRTGKPITSRGKLVDKYRNILRQYKSLTGPSTSKASTSNSRAPETDKDADEHVAWLKRNMAPWEEIVSKWDATHKFRRQQILTTRDLKIHEIFDSWPVLKHPDGYILIEHDFSSLHLTSVENDFDTWNSFFNLVRASREPKKDEHLDTLTEFLNQDNLSEDCRVTLQLLMLSHLVPPRGRVRIKKPNAGIKHWKPSVTECKASILVHTTIRGNFEKLQEERIAAKQSYGLTAQPFVIAVGPSLHEISTFYVSIDKVLYKVPSALHALNVCFKAFYVLDAAFPPESEHLWLLLQKGLFKFATKWDKSIPYILGIIEALSDRAEDEMDDEIA